jgi:hypothetical protein
MKKTCIDYSPQVADRYIIKVKLCEVLAGQFLDFNQAFMPYRSVLGLSSIIVIPCSF